LDQKIWLVNMDENKEALKLYLDTSVYNRPFDDQSQPRICIETLAFVSILQMLGANEAELITSSVLAYENSRNPFQLRRMWVNYCMRCSKYFVKVNASIKKRAIAIESGSVKSMDSLHIACAEASNCNYFITCDDRIIKRYKGSIKAQSPVDFILLVAERGGDDENG
jgi:hypothetical protein